MKALELTGQKFGRWTVYERQESKNYRSAWRCVCECGQVRIVNSGALKGGTSRSCGCLRSEEVSVRMKKHGGTCGEHRGVVKKGALYRTWAAMRNRCNNPDNNSYADYGGRGIQVCRRWDEFENFSADMGPRPDNTSLDRIDNNGNYEPSNCRWASRIVQMRNRRNTRPDMIWESWKTLRSSWYTGDL